MQHQPHKTLISAIWDCVDDWRKENKWSRETMAQIIVEAHERIGNDTVSGIVFDPPTRDTFERQRVNADRIFRWLDDKSKDNNLLPMNFLPSILDALPMDLRVALMNDLFRASGLHVSAMLTEQDALDAVCLLRDLLRESADAQRALVDLLDGATHAELVTAQKELTEAISAGQKALAAVNAQLVGAS